jgi:hypothetical protein
MEVFRKWWFYVVIAVIVIFLYYILGSLGVIPTYQCGTTMGPNGPVDWCDWHYGTVVG